MKLEEDPELADELLDAFDKWSRPRDIQETIGPSGIGGCREFLRATIAGDPQLPSPPRHLDEAFMGTVTGDAIETVWANTLPNCRVQVPITTMLPKTGFVVAGHADAVQPHRVLDLKSKTRLADIRRYGPSLENLVQVSCYLLGAYQMGMVEEGSYVALVYYDRTGKDKVFAAAKVDWDAAMRFVDLAEVRLLEVADVIDKGSPEEHRWALRDKAPNWCFGVGCPFRVACWGGSEWIPNGTVDDPESIDAIARYIQARDDADDAAARKDQARDDLKGMQGVTPDGRVVTWVGNTISVRGKI